MTVRYVVECPQCQRKFNPYQHQMTFGSGLIPECMRDIELLCHKVRHLNKGDGVPEVERLLTQAHEGIFRLARGGSA